MLKVKHFEGGQLFYLKDHQNSVIALANTNGQLVETYTYDAYGRTHIYATNGTERTRSAVGNRYAWQGREYDSGSGLYFFRARYYDPVMGRFLSTDPIGISGGLNLYEFCGSDPINMVDPLGLRDYTALQTQMILRDAVRSYRKQSSLMGLRMAISRHGSRGKYDYAFNGQSADRFVINDRQILFADQFGNYIAGYALRARFGVWGVFASELAGHYYEILAFDGDGYILDDPGSTEMIFQGSRDYLSSYREWDDLLIPDDEWQSMYQKMMECR